MNGIEVLEAYHNSNDGLQEIGYYKGRDDHMTPEMLAFKDENGNEFFSINIVVGVDNSPAYIDGGWIFPFERLFEYNEKRNNSSETEASIHMPKASKNYD